MIGAGAFGIVSPKRCKCKKTIKMQEWDILHHIREWWIGRSFFPNFYEHETNEDW